MGKWFVRQVLNSEWFRYDPKLKYADPDRLRGLLNLYSLVPCAWFSTVFSFVAIVPLYMFFWNRSFEGFLQHWAWSCLAGYAGGKVYLAMVNLTAGYWLYNWKDLEIVRREFEMA